MIETINELKSMRTSYFESFSRVFCSIPYIQKSKLFIHHDLEHKAVGL